MKLSVYFALGSALVAVLAFVLLVPGLRSEPPNAKAPIIESRTTKIEPATPSETLRREVRESAPPSWSDFLNAKEIGPERNSERLRDPEEFFGILQDRSGVREVSFVYRKDNWEFCIHEKSQCYEPRPVVEYGTKDVWTLYYPDGIRLFLKYMTVDLEDGFSHIRVLAGWLVKVGAEQPLARIVMQAQEQGSPSYSDRQLERFLPEAVN